MTIVIPSAAMQTIDRLPRHQLEVRGARRTAGRSARRTTSATSTSPMRTPRSFDEPPRGYEARAPDASINSECSVHASTGRAGAEAAARHHRDAIADAEQLRQVAADQEHRPAAFGVRRAARPPARRSARRSAPCSPTSMPRVGSSSTRTSTSWCSSRASATFCWLPPDSSPTGWRGCAQRMPRRSIHRAAAASCRAGSTVNAGTERLEPRQRQVVGDAQPEREAFARAVLAEHAHPLPPALVRPGPARSRRRRVTRPPLTGSRPKSARSSRVRPAPSSPAMPRISPRRSVSVAAPGTSAVELEDRLAGRARRCAGTDRRAPRPTIRLTIASARRLCGHAAAGVPAVAQHDEPIRDRLHFLDEVRDVDDRDAPAP